VPFLAPKDAPRVDGRSLILFPDHTGALTASLVARDQVPDLSCAATPPRRRPVRPFRK